MTNEPEAVGAIEVSREDGTVLARLTGEVDISNVDAFRAKLAETVRAVDAVVVDLSGVEFMDTSGLAFLIDIANTAASCVLRDPSSQVRRVVEASGLSGVLRIES